MSAYITDHNLLLLVVQFLKNHLGVGGWLCSRSFLESLECNRYTVKMAPFEWDEVTLCACVPESEISWRCGRIWTVWGDREWILVSTRSTSSAPQVREQIKIFKNLGNLPVWQERLSLMTHAWQCRAPVKYFLHTVNKTKITSFHGFLLVQDFSNQYLIVTIRPFNSNNCIIEGSKILLQNFSFLSNISVLQVCLLIRVIQKSLFPCEWKRYLVILRKYLGGDLKSCTWHTCFYILGIRLG